MPVSRHMRHMNQRCDIQFLQEVRDVRGGSVYTPVTQAANIPCRIIPPDPEVVQEFGRRNVRITHEVVFAQAVTTSHQHRLRHVDPDTGAARYFLCHGPVVNSHEIGRIWCVPCEEVP